MDISIVIPVLNEEKIISNTIAKILMVMNLSGTTFEIIFVDDGSNDETWKKIVETNILDSRIKGVKLSKNFGHDAAVFAGLKLSQSDASITMDCDGQHPFTLLPDLIKIWKETNCDVVNAVKISDEKRNWFRTLGAQFFGYIFRKTVNLELQNATEFKLISKKVREALLQCGDYHYFYRALVPWLGFHQRSLTFDVAPSMRSNSHWNFFSLARFAISGFVMFSDAPLKIILFFGFVTLIACFFLIVKLALAFFIRGVAEGYPTLLTIMLVNVGLLMTGIGVLGVYVRMILNQTKNRPRAIIDHCVPNSLLENSTRYL